MKTQIRSGKVGFCCAIVEAYYGSNAHSPEIRFSKSRGFFVESALTPPDSDVVYQERAMRFADTGKHTILPQNYPKVRELILNAEVLS